MHTEITVKGHQPGFLPVIHCSAHQGEILSEVSFLWFFMHLRFQKIYTYEIVNVKIFCKFKKYLMTMQAKMLLRKFLHTILNQVECILQAILRDERLGETNALLTEGSTVHNCSILTLWKNRFCSFKFGIYFGIRIPKF